MAFSGQLSFNPMSDSLVGADGKSFKFAPPSGSMLPSNGFTPGGFHLGRFFPLLHFEHRNDLGDLSLTPSTSPLPVPETEVVILPTSARLEILKPFSSHFAAEASSYELPPLKVLMRVRGKCTTDHISAAVSVLTF